MAIITAIRNMALSFEANKTPTSPGYSTLTRPKGVLGSTYGNWSLTWTEGTGSGQVNDHFFGTSSLVAGNTTDYNLAAMPSHWDANATAFGFADVKYLAIYNASLTEVISVAPSPSGSPGDPWNPWTPNSAEVYVQPGCVFELPCRFAGYPVTSSSKYLRVKSYGDEESIHHIFVIGVRS